MIVKGKVYTALDDYQRETWPTVFAEVPKIGSYLKSKSGKILKVVRITHSIHNWTYNDDPLIEIELHN